MDEKTELENDFLKVLFGLLMIPTFALWVGFVFVELWKWFIVPTFGIAPLRLVPAMGLACFVQWATIETHSRRHEKPSEGYWEMLAIGAISPAIALLAGWVIHLFM